MREPASVQAARSQMTVRSSSRYNDIFSPEPEDNLRYVPLPPSLHLHPPTSSLFLLFLRTIRHRSLSCVAVVVEQEETDWHSVDDGAHIDEGSLLLLLSPPAVLLLERGPGFASHFFRASRSSIFEPQPRRPLPDRSDRCGNNYRRTLALSRNKSKNHVKFRCSVMTFDHATEKGPRAARCSLAVLRRRLRRFDDDRFVSHGIVGVGDTERGARVLKAAALFRFRPFDRRAFNSLSFP